MSVHSPTFVKFIFSSLRELGMARTLKKIMVIMNAIKKQSKTTQFELVFYRKSHFYSAFIQRKIILFHSIRVTVFKAILKLLFVFYFHDYFIALKYFLSEIVQRKYSRFIFMAFFLRLGSFMGLNLPIFEPFSGAGSDDFGELTFR
jgi:hypothetical protein